ncbi:hypothetical protein RU86_GL000454 [Lactococcus piscium]|uniref:Uncharacterized protein n=1 Tax=Pseudolactococcus piscium TaxID=1364 RepID=A0A2A5RXK1_9LACT|nr:hypothetical protein [Lactococcus piscium]PCS05949.1 hypothetical protein RU86_GL000454 [Lactococcus piscium]
MTKQTLDSKGYETLTMQVGKITAKVSGVKNGLNTSTSHLKVAHIQTIFQIYDDLSRLISAYGEMVEKDLQEFRQVGVNIQQTDREGSK